MNEVQLIATIVIALTLYAVMPDVPRTTLRVVLARAVLALLMGALIAGALASVGALAWDGTWEPHM